MESLGSQKISIFTLVTIKSVGVVKGSKIYCRRLLVYLPVALVNPGSAIVSVCIKGCVYHAQQVDTPTRRHSTSVSSARQADTALQMTPPRRRHASYASRANMRPRQDLASAYHVPPVVLVLTTELPSTFRALSVGTTALQIRPSVWHALAGSMGRIMEQPYVLIVH